MKSAQISNIIITFFHIEIKDKKQYNIVSCIFDYLLIVLLRTCLLSLFFVGSVMFAFKKMLLQ